MSSVNCAGSSYRRVTDVLPSGVGQRGRGQRIRSPVSASKRYTRRGGADTRTGVAWCQSSSAGGSATTGAAHAGHVEGGVPVLEQVLEPPHLALDGRLVLGDVAPAVLRAQTHHDR